MLGRFSFFLLNCTQASAISATKTLQLQAEVAYSSRNIVHVSHESTVEVVRTVKKERITEAVINIISCLATWGTMHVQ